MLFVLTIKDDNALQLLADAACVLRLAVIVPYIKAKIQDQREIPASSRVISSIWVFCFLGKRSGSSETKMTTLFLESVKLIVFLLKLCQTLLCLDLSKIALNVSDDFPLDINLKPACSATTLHPYLYPFCF